METVDPILGFGFLMLIRVLCRQGVIFVGICFGTVFVAHKLAIANHTKECKIYQHLINFGEKYAANSFGHPFLDTP